MGLRARTSIEAVRRRDLIEAAYETFLEYGLGGMTVARIGQRAGMSHGLVNYYFKTKDELLTSVVRYANRTIMEEVRRRLRGLKAPRERLLAIVDSHFPVQAFNRATANAWISFYAAVPNNQAFERLHVIYYRRLHSNLIHDLRQLMPEEDAQRIARGISMLIDGIWMRCGVDPEGVSREAAVGLITHYLDSALPANEAPILDAATRAC